MKKIELGSQGLVVSAVGLGCMGMSEFYGSSDEAISHNLQLADIVADIANESEATPAQIALAWVLSRDDSKATIPGTRKIERLEENWTAQDLTLE